MIIMIVIIGLLTLLAGILPFLAGFGILPAIVPTSGIFYSGLVVLIGVIGFLYGIKSRFLQFKDKFVISALGILVIFGGVLPFLAERNLIPTSIPVSGPIYSGIMTLIGVITLYSFYKIAKGYRM